MRRSTFLSVWLRIITEKRAMFSHVAKKCKHIQLVAHLIGSLFATFLLPSAGSEVFHHA